MLSVPAIVITFNLGLGSRAASREWVRIPAPTANDLTSVHFSDALHGFAAGAFGTLLKTADGGLSWSTVPTPVNFSFVSVWSRAPDAALIGRVALYGTVDCGGNWSSDIGGYGAFFGSIFDLLFTTDDTGFFIKEGNVFRTTDGGTQWEQVGGSGQYLDDLHYAGGQTIYATGGLTFIDIFGSVSRGEVERSRDGGMTWAPLPLTAINDIYAAVWFSENSGLVFTFTNRAHRTDDGGDTWSVVTESMVDPNGAPLPALLIDAVSDDGHIVAVDFAGNFLESDDGAVWTVTSGSPESLSAIMRLPDGTLIVVGNAGNVWRSAAEVASRVPEIVALTLGNDGEGETVTIDARGTPGLTYRLVSSPDLRGWTPESTLTPGRADFSFVVGRPSPGTRWFYRIEEIDAGIP